MINLYDEHVVLFPFRRKTSVNLIIDIRMFQKTITKGVYNFALIAIRRKKIDAYKLIDLYNVRLNMIVTYDCFSDCEYITYAVQKKIKIQILKASF